VLEGFPLPAGAWNAHADFLPGYARPKLVRCLVTHVDGMGRGSIGISVIQGLERRTAAFLCDVRSGFCDALGEIEDESATAGALLDELAEEAGPGCAHDVPELAVKLLAGHLTISENVIPARVRDWLGLIFGPGLRADELPPTIAGINPSSIPAAQMPARVEAMLDECPSWLDLSPLTFQLAEEIRLRAGNPNARRDAGVYRYLFEHHLIDRLELYRRMLLWMAWLWNCTGLSDLATSALQCASELSNEQYAVPSHPFTVELTTRSLIAAQRLSENGAEKAIDQHHDESGYGLRAPEL
jgi:hypothetical protein